MDLFYQPNGIVWGEWGDTLFDLPLLVSCRPLSPTQQYSVGYFHDQPDGTYLPLTCTCNLWRMQEVRTSENDTICCRTCSLRYHPSQNMFFMSQNTFFLMPRHLFRLTGSFWILQVRDITYTFVYD